MIENDARARGLGSGLLLLVTALMMGASFALLPEDPRTRAALADVALGVAGLVAGAVLLVGIRGGRVWGGARSTAFGLAALGLTALAFAAEALSERMHFTAGPLDLIFLVFLAPILLTGRAEYREHFGRDETREVAVDASLIAASLACVGYLFMRPMDSSGPAQLSAAVFSILAAAEVATFLALAVRSPSVLHVSQAGVFAAFSVATYLLGWGWVRGTFRGGAPAVALIFGCGALALAALLSFAPRGRSRAVTARVARWSRPVLTSVAVAAASAALVFVAQIDEGRVVDRAQTSVLIAVLGAGIAIRILANQIRSTQANSRAHQALDQKEAALAEADAALDRVREANETLRESEEHLRLVIEAAVDGIVELDDHGVVLRANEAFCAMIGLPRDAVEGQSWTALAAAIKGADASFASLPTTGQGEIRREGHPLYLESRTSRIPMVPPRRLLLVRDVTAARVADQTIRSLFQFLQDRDEDRTRLLRRTNAAIETERNRIARDLHDGPVQGVSAASLSLEAALLMIKAGEIDQGLDVLGRIRKELSGEADALRSLMSGLRPPLLEERGLIPALRETIARFGRDYDLGTDFAAGAFRDVPEDLETLAYRVVQEALSNVGKHAKAANVSVQVEVEASQLRVEIADDGIGFDSAMAREFLRSGRVGLASMRERVELASGTFVVHSTPDRGTTILATLPLETVTIARELATR